jgi:hypothetical protein
MVRSGEGRFSRRGAEAQGGKVFNNDESDGEQRGEGGWGVADVAGVVVKVGCPAGRRGSGRGGSPAGARRRRGGKVFNNDGSHGEQRGEGSWGVAVVAVVVVKVGCPAGRRGPGTGGFPAGARRRGGGRFLTTTGATGGQGQFGCCALNLVTGAEVTTCWAWNRWYKEWRASHDGPWDPAAWPGGAAGWPRELRHGPFR